jgi:GNAT superfamily N-acetyltransferase
VSTIPSNPAFTAPATAPLWIIECSPSSPDASRLLRALHEEQVERYGFADPPELEERNYTQPYGVFAVAHQDAVPVGCAGYRWFDRPARTVELKRLYIAPASRGHGAGRALLSWLEQHAIAAGAQRAILETGVRNTVAIEVFTGAGYRPTDRYVPGRDPKINRAYARSLT